MYLRLTSAPGLGYGMSVPLTFIDLCTTLLTTFSPGLWAPSQSAIPFTSSPALPPGPGSLQLARASGSRALSADHCPLRGPAGMSSKRRSRLLHCIAIRSVRVRAPPRAESAAVRRSLMHAWTCYRRGAGACRHVVSCRRVGARTAWGCAASAWVFLSVARGLARRWRRGLVRR